MPPPSRDPSVEEGPALLVVNTRSRVGEAQFEHARDRLGELGLELTDAVALEDPARLEALIEGAVRAGVRRILVGGGDGSLSAAANVLAGTDVALGILPCGTGNDFARSLHIPADLDVACQILAQGSTRRVDLGRVNGRYFLNAASLGVTSDIAKNVNPGLKRRVGKLAYATAAASEAFKLSPFKARVVTEDTTLELDCAQVVVGNGRYHGGGSLIAPQASLHDRLLDVYVIAFEGTSSEDERLRIRDLLSLGRIGMLVRRGRHVHHDAVTHLMARTVSVETDPPLELDVDGEMAGTTPARFEVIPRALRVIAPAPPENPQT